MITELFKWWDEHPFAYALIFVASLALLAGRVGRTWRDGKVRADFWTACLVLAVLVAGRWPELFIAHGAPVGEARLIAAAITVAEQTRMAGAAVYHAGGPLSAFLLLPTHALGVPQDYFNARLVALLLDGVSLILLLGILAPRWGAGRAIAVLAPLMFALAMPGKNGMAAYSPAHGMLLLLCLAGWGVTRAVSNAAVGKPAGDTRTLLVAGTSLGLLPWVGLEGCWMAAGFAGVWAVKSDWPRDRRSVLMVMGVAGYVAAVGLALTHGVGAGPDFLQGYVRRDAAGQGLMAMEWAVLGMVLAAIGVRAARPRLAWVWVATSVAVVAVAVLGGRPRMLGQLAEHWRNPRGELARTIHAVRHPGDTLAIWGDAPELHVETALPAATRGNGINTEWARAEFLRDLRDNRPLFIVTAAGPESGWRSLADLLRENYRLLGADTAGRRVLLRADRMADLVRNEPGVVPVTLRGLATAEAFGGVGELGVGRISAHPPSRLVHHVPANAAELRGIFGFLPPAYANPPQMTDGARFIINWRWASGRAEQMLDRYLSPALTEGDRDAVEFRLEVPADRPEQVEFIVEPGPTMSYDWVYWAELRFRPTR